MLPVISLFALTAQSTVSKPLLTNTEKLPRVWDQSLRRLVLLLNPNADVMVSIYQSKDSILVDILVNDKTSIKRIWLHSDKRGKSLLPLQERDVQEIKLLGEGKVQLKENIYSYIDGFSMVKSAPLLEAPPTLEN